MYFSKRSLQIIHLLNMLSICMSKANQFINEIELSLEEKFAKCGRCYKVSNIQLNDGSTKGVYLDFYSVQAVIYLDLIIEKTIIMNIMTLSSEETNWELRHNADIVKKLIKHSDNVVKFTEAITNLALVRFSRIKDGAIYISNSNLEISLSSKFNIKVVIAGSFVEDTDVFVFRTNSRIKGVEFKSLELAFSQIKEINTINDLYKACWPYRRYTCHSLCCIY